MIEKRKLLLLLLLQISSNVSQASILQQAKAQEGGQRILQRQTGSGGNSPLSPAALQEEFANSNSQQKASKEKFSERRDFAVELLKMLHEQYSKAGPEVAGNAGIGGEDEAAEAEPETAAKKHQQRLKMGTQTGSNRGLVMTQLLNALNADGDVSRLLDWVRNSFNIASVGELTTQFVVSKLGSVNCAALLKPDDERTLIPRFLLFNEHFPDVPFEMPLAPSAKSCLANGRFDPMRRTVILMHGYLGGYTITDGLTNIKNRILDLNRELELSARKSFPETSFPLNNTFQELDIKIRIQKYNVIIVDWYNGANPIVRSRYIRAAVNAQVVGQLLARFLLALVQNCRTPAQRMQIIAHSLGCHVAGFTGKSMLAAGHKLGKITHLDPIGLCFGRLFSEPRFRLNPNDALLTQAVHVSLNIFDNPLDGVQENFMVNGGRDQLGCGGQSELRNSTASSVSILFDSEARFGPCSHMRALALFEEDLSSRPNQCQIVGYKCPTYDHFLAGRCGRCDEQNGQCRLMSLPALQPIQQIHSMPIPRIPSLRNYNLPNNISMYKQNASFLTPEEVQLTSLVEHISNGSIAWVIDDKELNQKIGSAIAKLRPDIVVDRDKLRQYSEALASENINVLNMGTGRSDFEAVSDSSEPPPEAAERRKFSETMDKLKLEAKSVLADGWTSLASAVELPKLTISSMFNGKLAAEKLTSALINGYQMLPEHLGNRLKLAAAGNESNLEEAQKPEELLHLANKQPTPLGGQQPPAGASNGPLYFVGTSSMSPYCVNYYQFRVLIAESRVNNLLRSRQLQFSQASKLASGNNSNKQKPLNNLSAIEQTATSGKAPTSANKQFVEGQQSAKRDQLHLSVKLTDSFGRFFKGFTLVEDARNLRKIPLESHFGYSMTTGSNDKNLIELTMLLNSTRPEPVKVTETVISYYFHNIVLADSIQVNYMSNISPEIRARFSSTLCPLAINDKHQLVRYVECDRSINAKKR